MELDEIWIWYANERLGGKMPGSTPVAITPWAGFELLFAWNRRFTPMADVAKAVSFDPSFDEEADGALAALAHENSFARWDGLSAGAWRVLWERLVFAQTMMLVWKAKGEEFIAVLPQGLDRRSQSRAFGLMQLLGPARTIDRKLLAKAEPGTLPLFPASTTARRQ